jgi:hypothetical protein
VREAGTPLGVSGAVLAVLLLVVFLAFVVWAGGRVATKRGRTS